MRGPICSPLSMRFRASIMPSGSYSPAGNVDVTPLARKMSGLYVYSSPRTPTGAERHVVVRMDVEEARQDVLVVAQLDHARSRSLRGGDRSVDGVEPAARMRIP